MIPFGDVDTFTSTLDFRTMARAIGLRGKQTIRQLTLGKV